jgi:thiamine kinase-like enzyme
MKTDLILKFIEDEYHTKGKIVHRLLGGMSNFTYVVEIDGSLYTIRIPGKGSEHFTNRQEEGEILNIVSKQGFLPKPTYFNKETGYKVAPYVEGTPLHEISTEEKPYELVASTLKKLHTQKAFPYDYQPLKRLEYYESISNNHDDLYMALKEKFLEVHKKILKKVPLMPCHGDAQPSNFIIGEDQLYLVDWEFAGNNDPIYDIACFGNVVIDEAIALLQKYYANPSTNEYQRLYAWRMFQCLQWYNVATYKEEIGLSEELAIDFAAVAQAYLEKAKTFYQNYLEVSKGE